MNLAGVRRRTLIRLGSPPNDSFFAPGVVDDAVNQALAAIDGEENWPWSEAFSTFTLTGSTLSLPSGWKAVKAVLIDGHELTPITSTEALALPATSGTPVCYAVIGSTVELRPAPIGSTAVTVIYYAAERELRYDTDTAALPDRYTNVAVAKAAELLATREGDRNAQALHLADYNAGLNRMRRSARSTTKPTTIKVRPGGWL